MRRIQKQGSLQQTLGTLDPNLKRVFGPWVLHHPRKWGAYRRLLQSYRQSKQIRQYARAQGETVPPFLILSITSRCNLACLGCYATAVGTVRYASPLPRVSHDITPSWSLHFSKWRSIVAEAYSLGVFGFIIAGGEPFLQPGLLSLCQEFSDNIYVIFTNGTAIRDVDFTRLKRLSNVAVVVSIEGSETMTDYRRGYGVHARALATIKRLAKAGILCGVSITISRLNFTYWMDQKNIDALIELGVRLGIFIEYIPSSAEIHVTTTNENVPIVSHLGEETMLLSRPERVQFRKQVLVYRAQKAIYMIHSPSDEDFFGGCVSAGRGFAHVTPDGDLTPCPVSNIATHNLITSSLREGLASPLFQRIRESDHLLETGETPCALFAQPEEVAQMVKDIGAYRTGRPIKSEI